MKFNLKKKEIYIIFYFLAFSPLIFFKAIGLNILMNTIFYLIILTITISFVVFREKKIGKLFNDLSQINEKINLEKDLDKEKIEKILEKNEEIYFYFNKFNNDNNKPEKNIKPEKYFNLENLFYTKLNINLYTYIPNLFVSIGILGTFLGLALGLKNISVVNIFSESQELLANNIKNLLVNVSTSFYTSLYGIYYSIIFYVLSLIVENEYEIQIYELNKILTLYFYKDKPLELLNNFEKEILFIKNKIQSMVKTFEIELEKTLYLVFNENYVTSMNKIQNEFIENSKSLVNITEENIKALKEVEKMTKIVELFNMNIKELTNKVYSKEQLEIFVKNINDYINKNNDIVKKFDESQYNIAETIKRFEKILKNNHYNQINEIMLKTKEISDANKQMIEKYYRFYSETDLHNITLNNNIKMVKDKVEILNTYLNDLEKNGILSKLFDYIVYKDKLTLENLNDEINKNKLKYVNNRIFFDFSENIDEDSWKIIKNIDKAEREINK